MNYSKSCWQDAGKWLFRRLPSFQGLDLAYGPLYNNVRGKKGVELQV
jgi:hypothetical protein